MTSATGASTHCAMTPSSLNHWRCGSLLCTTILLFLSSLLQISQASDAISFYVATNGNDAWSGRVAQPGADRKDGPFATLPAALKAARQARQSGNAAGGINLWLRGGVYELPEPVVLTPED